MEKWFPRNVCLECFFSNRELLITEDMYDMVILLWIMNDSSTFQCDSCVRGYYVYIEIWKPLVGECLKCVKESTNKVDKNAVAVVCTNSHCKEVVVGHVPINISKIVFMFLFLSYCALNIMVTGKCVNHEGGYELEIPASFHFYDPEKAKTG